MSLRVRVHGPDSAAGLPWVLLHGWGFDGAVMDPLAGRLAEGRRVLVIDLPGFRADDTAPCGTDLAVIADAVCDAVPGSAHWLGWSLGGLVALAAAGRRPGRVSGVDLLAATPRFVEAPDWPGIAAGDLDRFAQAIMEDPVSAHGRFLGFQLAGSEGARAALRRLRSCSERNGLPTARTLADGLEILRDSDLREALVALSCPVRAILGAADPLVPAAVAAPLADLGVGVRMIEGAGHAPFLSHPDAVLAALRES